MTSDNVMNKNFFFVLIIFLTLVSACSEEPTGLSSAEGKPPKVLWEKVIELGDKSYATTLCPTPDDGMLVGGITRSNEHGRQSVAMLLDAQGNAVWQTILGQGGGDESIYASACVEDGYIVAGVTNRNFSQSSTDGWAVKLDKNGKILWDRTFDVAGEPDSFRGGAIALTNGLTALVGRTLINDVSYPLIEFVDGQGCSSKRLVLERYPQHSIISSVSPDGKMIFLSLSELNETGSTSNTTIISVNDIFSINIIESSSSIIWLTEFNNDVIGLKANEDKSLSVKNPGDKSIKNLPLILYHPTKDGMVISTGPAYYIIALIEPRTSKENTSCLISKTDDEGKTVWSFLSSVFTAMDIKKSTKGNIVLAGAKKNVLYEGKVDLWIARIE